MSQPADNITEARKFASPRPLEGAWLKDFWVDTEDARDTVTSFRQNLLDCLNEETPHRILVHGHRGCGKSTELNKIATLLDPQQWLIVSFSAGDYLPVSGNEAADVLLAMCVRVLEQVEKTRLTIDEQSAKSIHGFFSDVTKTQNESHESNLKIDAGVSSSETWWGKLLGLKAGLVAALKFGSRAETSTVEKVRKRKGELIDAMNGFLLNVEHAWKTKQKNQNARVLIVVEDLDKFGLADARKLFIQDGRLLSEIAVRVVYTIPVFTFHSPDAGAIRSFFEHDIGLPMIKTNLTDGSVCREGRDILKKIVRKRIAATVMADDVIDRLIERTGGVIRHLFEAIQNATSFRRVQQHGIIERADIDTALDRMVSDLGVQISYPPEDKKNPRPLQEKLAEFVKCQTEKKKISAQPDPDVQLLLMSGALIEYNGDRWLGVHPLARDYLASLNLISP